MSSLFGQFRPGVDTGQGKNRSSRGPFSKVFNQTGMIQQTECIVIIKRHTGRRVVTLCSIPKSDFDVVLDFILLYFNAISIDFYEESLYNFRVYK